MVDEDKVDTSEHRAGWSGRPTIRTSSGDMLLKPDKGVASEFVDVPVDRDVADD